MGRLFLISLTGSRIYSCRHCSTHLCRANQIISTDFQGRHGQAYLIKQVVNVTAGDSEVRLMMTGLHTVRDIYCVACGSRVGWKYEKAPDRSQRYKVGKFVLERFQIIPSGIEHLINLAYQQILGNPEHQNNA